MAYTTIDDPSAYFQIATWSGDNATTQNITNDGNSDLQPDWVWVKCRNTAGNGFDHTVWDTSRGVDNNVNKSLSPSQDDTEGLGDNVTTTAQLGGVSAMLSDGFTVREGSVDDDSRYVNENTRTYVGWQWKCNGGTTTTNDASSTGVGGLDSVYQANTTAGFSIVTYTGSGSNTTVAHGLGNVPEVIIFKKRTDDTEDWLVYHHTQGNASAGKLNTNAAWETGSNSLFDATTPTSSVFSIKTNSKVNDSSDTYVAYCFSEVQGYSKFGKYTGNGNADGAFVYLGFKPALIIVRATDTDNWRMYDHKRADGHNVIDVRIIADTNAAESQDDNECDFLSNGVKWRSSSGGVNSDGQAYTYMAWAEHPFVSSKGVPTTAE